MDSFSLSTSPTPLIELPLLSKASSSSGDLVTIIGNSTNLCDVLVVVGREYGCSLQLQLTSDESQLTKFCSNLVYMYKRSCSTKETERHAALSMTMYILILFACLAGQNFLQRRNIVTFSNSNAAIVIGLLIGYSTKLIMPSTLLSDIWQFDERLIFVILIPPIIFNAGLSLDKVLFRRNMWTVLTLAFPGTAIAALIVAYILYSLSQYTDSPLPQMESLLFGILISSVDPVSIISVFNAFGVDRLLFILVCGEAILNDALVFVSYSAVVEYIEQPSLTLEIAGSILFDFIVVASGSLLIALALAFATTMLFKYVRFASHLTEIAVFMALGFVPFYIGIGSRMSSIVSLVVSSMLVDVFALQYTSPGSAHVIKEIAEGLANMCENLIFGYLGLAISFMSLNIEGQITMIHFTRYYQICFVAIFAVCVSRLAVYPMSWLCNLGRKRKLGWNMQHLMYSCGLRGTLSLALVASVPVYDPILDRGSKFVPEMTTATVAVIIANGFLLGALCPYLLQYFGVTHHASEGNSKHVTIAIHSDPNQPFQEPVQSIPIPNHTPIPTQTPSITATATAATTTAILTPITTTQTPPPTTTDAVDAKKAEEIDDSGSGNRGPWPQVVSWLSEATVASVAPMRSRLLRRAMKQKANRLSQKNNGGLDTVPLWDHTQASDSYTEHSTQSENLPNIINSNNNSNSDTDNNNCYYDDNCNQQQQQSQ